jgi:hypothetical protein
MDPNAFDDFDIDVQVSPHSSGLAALSPPACPAEVQHRFDAFRKHRDKTSRNILGLLFSWPSPAYLLYDWYQSECGMTVSLETLSTITWTRPSLITVRVRHHNPALDRSTLRLGQTLTIHPDHPASLTARTTIMDAVSQGVSPLWEMRNAGLLNTMVLQSLELPMKDGMTTGHLDHQITDASLLVGLINAEEILEALGAHRSSYRTLHQK